MVQKYSTYLLKLKGRDFRIAKTGKQELAKIKTRLMKTANGYKDLPFKESDTIFLEQKNTPIKRQEMIMGDKNGKPLK